MRLIRVKAVVEDGRHKGYSLDAEAYLTELPKMQADLPEGARSFALDEDHYNFFGPRCVKDLKIGRATIEDSNDCMSMVISFDANKFKHDAGLTIRYTDVSDLAIDVTSGPRSTHVWPATKRLGDLQIDEILPHQNGCSHEIQMTGGSIKIVCADLFAEWQMAATASDALRPRDEHVE